MIDFSCRTCILIINAGALKRQKGLQLVIHRKWLGPTSYWGEFCSPFYCLFYVSLDVCLLEHGWNGVLGLTHPRQWFETDGDLGIHWGGRCGKKVWEEGGEDWDYYDMGTGNLWHKAFLWFPWSDKLKGEKFGSAFQILSSTIIVTQQFFPGTSQEWLSNSLSKVICFPSSP